MHQANAILINLNMDAYEEAGFDIGEIKKLEKLIKQYGQHIDKMTKILNNIKSHMGKY